MLSGWTPLADVTETNDAYVIKVEVPGVKREDIRLEVSGTELAIRGETKADDEGGQPRQRARRYGRFEYRAALPTQIDTSAITAEMGGGVLTIRVPKSQADQPAASRSPGSRPRAAILEWFKGDHSSKIAGVRTGRAQAWSCAAS